MAFGLPIVTTSAVGCVDDLVADGINGYVVPPKDETRLGNALKRLALSSDLRQRMGKESSSRISKWTMSHYLYALETALKAAVRETHL